MNHFEEEPFKDLVLDKLAVRVVGTAHVSRASKDFVAKEINEGGYDGVAVELCSSRYQQLTDPASVETMDLFEVIRKKKVTTLAVMLALSAFQQRIAGKINLQPGAEQKAAIDTARQKGLPVYLIDRDIGITFSRFSGTVSWWERIQVFSGLLSSIISRDDPTAAEIESLKKGDMLEQVVSSLAESSPNIHAVLIAERDQYMAAKIATLVSEAKNIIVVVGAGHLKGISNSLAKGIENPELTIQDLECEPARKKWLRLIPVAFLLLVLAGFGVGFYRSPELGLEIITEWILINGGLSALGVLLASGHPITVLTGFLAAPITSLNPTIGAGMATGLVEAWVRKPTVSDFANLKTDSGTVSGWRRNRVSRTFLVFMFSSFGSAIGTYVAGFRIFEKLFV